MRIELKPLAEQVVVVVGATSGIGRATALAAGRAGARVVAAARGEVALATLAGELDSAAVATVRADAGHADDMEAVARAAVERFGRIDTWAHVAGVGEFARFEDHTPDELRKVVEVDLLGPMYGARAALPHLRREGRGALVIVSSETARRAFPLLSAYCAAKHGVDGFVEALRAELQHDGVPVSLTQVLPGAVATPFFEHARTRLGVRPSGPPPVVRAERVAAAILQAAEHPRREIVVGGAARMQLALQRLSPRLVDAVVARTAFRLERSDEPKRPADPDTLDEPWEGDDRVRGVVTTTRR